MPKHLTQDKLAVTQSRKLSRVLMLGYGSIGRRHLANWRLLYPALEYAVCDPCLKDQIDRPAVVFDREEDAWDWGADVVFVCSPSSYHLPQAALALKRGCHVFVEKPLSHTWEGVDEFLNLYRKAGLVVQVGANMRYHSGPRRLKALLDQNFLGRIFSVTTHYGGNLADWHPGQDYRQSYSAHGSLGGGVVLDVIHEIDLALWYIGRPTAVSAMLAQSGLLEIETEDLARLLIRGAHGVIADVKLDYLQRPARRGCVVMGEKGRLRWENGQTHVEFIKPDGEVVVIPLEPEALANPNQIYIDQLRDFVDCVENNKQPMVSAPEGAMALRVALGAKESARRGLEIKL